MNAYQRSAWQEVDQHSRLDSRVRDLEASERRLTARIDVLERRAWDDRIERDRQRLRDSLDRIQAETSQTIAACGVATVLALVLIWAAFSG